MKLFPINLHKLGVALLPVLMRSASMVEFYRILLKGFEAKQDGFFNKRTKTLYNLTHNGQVCKLRAVLNDAFPTRDKTFLIEDVIGTSGEWLYAKDEDEENRYEQLFIPDEPDYKIVYDEERMTKFADFVVKIPSSLQSVDNMNLIRALVNAYKLTSKKAIYEYYKL